MKHAIRFFAIIHLFAGIALADRADGTKAALDATQKAMFGNAIVRQGVQDAIDYTTNPQEKDDWKKVGKDLDAQRGAERASQAGNTDAMNACQGAKEESSMPMAPPQSQQSSQKQDDNQNKQQAAAQPQQQQQVSFKSPQVAQPQPSERGSTRDSTGAVNNITESFAKAAKKSDASAYTASVAQLQDDTAANNISAISADVIDLSKFTSRAIR